jgi:hypothetical protein
MTTNVVHYALIRLAIGSQESIDITQADFDELAKARNALSEVMSFEEKFFAICENYRSLEEFVLSTSLSDMIFRRTEVPEIHSIGATFSRLTLALLASVRLYFDSLTTHSAKLSDGAVSAETVKSILAAKYDSSQPFRFMEAIRNYAQHRAFPVHTTTLNSRLSDDLSIASYSTNFYFEIALISTDDKFKKSIRNELESLGKPIDLKDCIRSYFSSVCEIHDDVRTIYERHQAVYEAVIEKWQQAWASSFPTVSLLGVAACQLTDGLRQKDDPKVHISPQIDAYRKFLRGRTMHLKNMHRRQVAF